MGRNYVKRLEDIAFSACYQDILSNLILCQEHRPENERHPITRSSLISCNPLFTSQNVLYNVRENLNQHLVGTLNDDFRAKIIREFTKVNCAEIFFIF